MVGQDSAECCVTPWIVGWTFTSDRKKTGKNAHRIQKRDWRVLTDCQTNDCWMIFGNATRCGYSPPDGSLIILHNRRNTVSLQKSAFIGKSQGNRIIVANLSPSGTQLVQNLSQRYGVSTDAVTQMLQAVYNGNGSMAQFSHPEFGGSGQWMSGGMTMVSDLFNYNLKNLVNNLCSEISNSLANNQTTPFSGSFQSQSQNGMHSQSQAAGQIGSANSLFVPDPTSNWWPQDLGIPSALGSQNNTRYAYFANSHRLAVTAGGPPWVYDTLDHQIGGFGQQQGGGQSITFTSQYGTVNLSNLPVVSRDGVAVPPAPMPAEPMPMQIAVVEPMPATPSISTPVESTRTMEPPVNPAMNQKSGEEIIATLERLGGLMDKGYITKEEFETKKSELLGRI